MTDLERVLRSLAGPPCELDLDAVEAGARKRRRRGRAGAAGGVVALLVLVVATGWVLRANDEPSNPVVAGPGDPAEATVVVTPPFGPVGTEIRLRGAGFDPAELGQGAEVPVYLFRHDPETDDDHFALLGEVTIESDGSFTLQATIPEQINVARSDAIAPVEPGEYGIVVGPTANQIPGVTFQVTTGRAGGDVAFDPPEGVAGAVVTLSASGLDVIAGQEAGVWLDHPTGGLNEIARGSVSADGHLVIDVQIPNVVQHEHWVTPGPYQILIFAQGAAPEDALVTTLDVVKAQVGVRYRVVPSYECFDFLRFDGRLWVGVEAVDYDTETQAGIWAPGTFILTKPDQGRFTTAAGLRVDFSVATRAEASAFDPETFQCPIDPDSNVVRERDRVLMADLVRFARAPSPEAASALAFADSGVDIGLSERLIVRRSPAELTDPSQWVVDDPQFRNGAFVGPFSALDLLSRPGSFDTSVGPHPHCASPPVPPPVSVAQLRRVSAQPAGIDDCLSWFTVDVYVDANYVIQAVTLDRWES